jgi:hypothetical protein
MFAYMYSQNSASFRAFSFSHAARASFRASSFSHAARASFRAFSFSHGRAGLISRVFIFARPRGRLGSQVFILASGHGIARARGGRLCVDDWAYYDGGGAVEMVGAPVPACPRNVTYALATEGLLWQRFHPQLMAGNGENVVLDMFLQSYRSRPLLARPLLG